MLRHALARGDVAKAALGGRLGDQVQHLRGEVVGDDLAGPRREAEADMAGPAAEIEDAQFFALARKRGERVEVGALRMHGALEIGGRLLSELPADQGLMT